TLFQWQIRQEELKVAGTPAELLGRQDADGDTVLHIAVAQGKRALTYVLALKMAAGGELDLKEHNGQTALQIAAATNNHLIVRDLLTHGAKVNTRDLWGRSPLHVCAQKGHALSLQVRNHRSFSPTGHLEDAPEDPAAAGPGNVQLRRPHGAPRRHRVPQRRGQRAAGCEAPLRLQERGAGGEAGGVRCHRQDPAAHGRLRRGQGFEKRTHQPAHGSGGGQREAAAAPPQQPVCSRGHQRHGRFSRRSLGAAGLIPGHPFQAFNGNTVVHAVCALQDSGSRAAAAAKLLLRRGADPAVRNLENELPWQLAPEGPAGEQVL
ncbi:unnamed protein product, partial [Tetraodon nigroviridis]